MQSVHWHAFAAEAKLINGPTTTDRSQVTCSTCIEQLEAMRVTTAEFDAAVEKAVEKFGAGNIRFLIVLKGSPGDELTRLRATQRYIERYIKSLENEIEKNQ